MRCMAASIIQWQWHWQWCVVGMCMSTVLSYPHLSFDSDNFLCDHYNALCEGLLSSIDCPQSHKHISGCGSSNASSLALYEGVCACSSQDTQFHVAQGDIPHELFLNRIDDDVYWLMTPLTGPPYEVNSTYRRICDLALSRLGCPSGAAISSGHQRICSCGALSLDQEVRQVIVHHTLEAPLMKIPVFARPITLSTRLSLALVVIGGKLGSLLALRVRLPPIIGFLVAGISLQDVISPGLIHGCGGAGPHTTPFYEINTIALLVVLIRAGLTLRPAELYQQGLYTIALATLPYITECLVELLVGMWILDWNILDMGLFASILAALSPSLVIPAMINLIEGSNHRGKYGIIPKQVLSSAPLEVVLAILLFNIFATLHQSSDEGHATNSLYPWVKVFPLWVNIILIPINVAFSSVLGYIMGYCCAWHASICCTSLEITDDAVTQDSDINEGTCGNLTDSTTESAIMSSESSIESTDEIVRSTKSSPSQMATVNILLPLFIGCYLLYALCTPQYIQQSSGILAVFISALTFSYMAPKGALVLSKSGLESLWVVLEIFLFTSTGINLAFRAQNGPLQSQRGLESSHISAFCVILFMGTLGRGVSILVVQLVATYRCQDYTKGKYKRGWRYIGSRWIATWMYQLPKATVQAALGGVALSSNLIPGTQGLAIATTILHGTAFAVLLMAPIGVLMTTFVGNPLSAYLACRDADSSGNDKAQDSKVELDATMLDYYM